ncbi:MAG: HAD-IA family hydrolase [Pseudonocardiaceae bacterium]
MSEGSEAMGPGSGLAATVGEALVPPGLPSAADRQVEAVFFDIRDTLGVVDRRGHLLKYKPTTDQLLEAMKQVVGLRIGLITNLPENVSSSDGEEMVKEAGIWEFLDPQGWVTNHDAGVEKPTPEIFVFAARQMGLAPERCLFVGENLTEVIAAQAAGMRAVLKPFPPGREFLHKPIKALPPEAKSSGRLTEIVLEEDHLVDKRIVGAAMTISDRLAGDPAAVMADQKLLRAMGLLVWLTKNFIDPFHHRKVEEVLIPFALARGLDPRDCAWVALEHDQGRTYFRGMDLALRRMQSGDANACKDFAYCVGGFVELYKEHARKENDELFTTLGDMLTEADDALIVDLMGRIGPADLTLYLTVIAEMEAGLA